MEQLQAACGRQFPVVLKAAIVNGNRVRVPGQADFIRDIPKHIRNLADCIGSAGRVDLGFPGGNRTA